MKRIPLHFLVGAVLAATIVMSWAQATPPPQPPKGYAERYGRYNRPGAPPGAPGVPMTPGSPVQQAPPVAMDPSTLSAIRFGAVRTNTSFYIATDTNRTYLWIKTSANNASNTVNSKVAQLPAALLVITNLAIERPPAAEPPPAEPAPSPVGDPTQRRPQPRPPGRPTGPPPTAPSK